MLKSHFQFFFLSCVLTLTLSSACKQPVEIKPSAGFSTPDEVVENMVAAYAQKNAELYAMIFSEQSTFLINNSYRWNFETEKYIHAELFARSETLDLQMIKRHSSPSNENSLYNYSLTIEHADDIVIEGVVGLDFEQKQDDAWQIIRFNDLGANLKNVANKKYSFLDSASYLPLQIGNKWVYHDQINYPLPDQVDEITDTLRHKNNLYYKYDLYSTDYVRVDSLGLVQVFFISDSSERAMFNLNSNIGDSTIFYFPGLPQPFFSILWARLDSFSVPAGTFADVLWFMLDNYNTPSLMQYYLAKDIGVIRYDGTNSHMVLKNAVVNGKNIGNTTGIRKTMLSWTQFKETFFK